MTARGDMAGLLVDAQAEIGAVLTAQYVRLSEPAAVVEANPFASIFREVLFAEVSGDVSQCEGIARLGGQSLSTKLGTAVANFAVAIDDNESLGDRKRTILVRLGNGQARAVVLVGGPDNLNSSRVVQTVARCAAAGQRMAGMGLSGDVVLATYWGDSPNAALVSARDGAGVPLLDGEDFWELVTGCQDFFSALQAGVSSDWNVFVAEQLAVP